MVIAGFAALLANAMRFILLWDCRSSDSNMQTVRLDVAKVTGAFPLRAAWAVTESSSRDLAGLKA